MCFCLGCSGSQSGGQSGGRLASVDKAVSTAYGWWKSYFLGRVYKEACLVYDGGGREGGREKYSFPFMDSFFFKSWIDKGSVAAGRGGRGTQHVYLRFERFMRFAN